MGQGEEWERMKNGAGGRMGEGEEWVEGEDVLRRM